MERHRGRHVNYGKYSMHLLPTLTLMSTSTPADDDDDKEQLLLCFNRKKMGKVVGYKTHDFECKPHRNKNLIIFIMQYPSTCAINTLLSTGPALHDR